MNKKELSHILTLAWPAIIQEAMAVVVSYVDTAMVGALGANASAAIGLTGTVNWLTAWGLSMGLGVGVLSTCAKADGANQKERLKKAGQQAFFITLVLGIVLTIGCLAAGPYLPTWLNGDVSIRNDVSIYFMSVSAPFLFRTALTIFGCALQGVSDMKSPMIINILTNIINIVLNFFFIYPTRLFFGITVWGAGLGVMGAAIASATSFTIGGTLMFIRYIQTPAFGIKEDGFKYDSEVMGQCIKIGIPVMAERGVICLGHVVFSSLIAQLGVIPFAAHTIAIQAEQAFYIPGYGFQSACATIVGNSVGMKDEAKAKRTTYTIASICFGLMTIAGILLFIFAPQLMSIFTPDIEVIQQGSVVLRMVALSEPIFGVLVTFEGTFNGMGDTKAPFIFSLFTMWFIRVLGTFVAINILHLNLTSVWIMMIADNCVRCFLLSHRFISGKWKYLIEC